MMRLRAHSRSTAGFSLPELLVVVAIIGVILLVSMPNFLNYRQSSNMKSSVRQFATDLRSARQLAVTRSLQTRVTFSTVAATDRRTYQILSAPIGSTTWTVVKSGTLGPHLAFFANDAMPTFPDTVAADGSEGEDGKADIVFRPDGTVVMDGLATSVYIRSEDPIPMNQAQLILSPTGQIKSVASKY